MSIETERFNDDNHWNNLLDDIDNNFDNDENSWGLLMPKSIASYNDENTIDNESRKLIDLDQLSVNSIKTTLTISESEELLIDNDGDDNDENGDYDDEDDNDELSDSEANFCLKTLRSSDYDTKLHKYLYPIPDDPGLVPGFWILYPKPPSYEHDGIDKFKDLVGTMKLQPIKRIPQMLRSNEIDLKYYGVNPRLVRAICDAAINNSSVKTLDLQDNWLTIDACFHLNNLLVNNNVLSAINLSGCRIGPRGAKRLQEGIGAAPALKRLDISRCDLGDEGLTYISTGVYCSSSLQIVNLKDNKLNDDSRIPFQLMLTQSDNLTALNLSWNSLFSYEFWKKFIAGLSRNNALTHLDLSCNSLGKECSPLLAKYLLRPSSLRELNLKGNKFETDEAVQIADALMNNTTLEVLYLGNNPIKDIGADAIIKSITPQLSPNSKLRLLDLENIWASKDIIPLMNKLNNERPLLNIKLGGILNNLKVLEPDARKIFLRRANFETMNSKKRRYRKNFGHFILSLDDSIISKDAFEKLIKRYKLKLGKSLIIEIMNTFAIGDDAIDQRALKTFYLKEYPETHPPPLKSIKKKKKIMKKTKKINVETDGKKRKPLNKKKSKSSELKINRKN